MARAGATYDENRAVHAMARLMLHGSIDNVQTSWVKLGIEGTQAMLQSGANDLGGTLMEETISRMAGSEFGSYKTVADIQEITRGIGRPVVQRTTVYGPVDPDRHEAAKAFNGLATSRPPLRPSCPPRTRVPFRCSP